MITNIPLTISEVLKNASAQLQSAGISSARLDSELILCKVLHVERIYLYSNPEKILSEKELEEFQLLLEQRLQRKPIQYITGKQEFWSRDFVLNDEVLVPRPETELLIETIIVDAEKLFLNAESEGRSLRILDVGTGSGIIAITIKNILRSAIVVATDISYGALKIAKLNSSINVQRDNIYGNIRFIEADIFQAFSDSLVEKKKAFDIIVANPPYISSVEIDRLQPEVSKWEPRVALDGGDRGTEIIEKIIRAAWEYLIPGGMLLIETGESQKEELIKIIDSCGKYVSTKFINDCSGKERALQTWKKS